MGKEIMLESQNFQITLAEINNDLRWKGDAGKMSPYPNPCILIVQRI